MIKICNMPIVYIKSKDVFRGDSICQDYVEELKTKRGATEIQYIIRNGREVIGTASLEEISKNQITKKLFTLVPSLFVIVRDYVYENDLPEGKCFPVVDNKGRFLFLVEYKKNIYLDIKHNKFSDYEEKFKDIGKLDFEVINKYKTFIFMEVEEYSIAIAKLLQSYCPDKKVYFGDKKATFFVTAKKLAFFNAKISNKCVKMLENFTRGGDRKLNFCNRVFSFCLYRIVLLLQAKGEVCVIAENKNYSWPFDMMYNSEKIMYSLLWCNNQRVFGDKNEDKIIVVLDYACCNEGLVSIMRWTFAHIMWILKKGYTPVVDLCRKPNQYLNCEKENMWEYFFDPVSEISVSEAYQSYNVISAWDNSIVIGESKINPYQERWKELPFENSKFSQIVKLNEETERYIEEQIPSRQCFELRILGVTMRGTDFRKEAAMKNNKMWRADIIDANSFLDACKYYKKKLKCKYVFLATEDAEYLKLFKDCFGEELLFVEQKRVSYDYIHKEYIPVKDLLHIQDGKEAGRKYLAAIMGLAKSCALIYNVECGAVSLAKIWNDNKYEVCKKIECDWDKWYEG